MRIGQFSAGWRRVDRREQIELGLESPWLWQVFEIQLFSFGLTICARPWVPPRG